jgi:adenine-specific DNA methylase
LSGRRYYILLLQDSRLKERTLIKAFSKQDVNVYIWTKEK